MIRVNSDILYAIRNWVQNQMSAVLAAMPEQDRLLSQVQLQCAWNYLNLFDKPEEAGIMFQESLKACTLQVPIAAVHVVCC